PLERELVEALCELAADADRRRVLEEAPHTGNLRQLAAEFLNDVVDSLLPGAAVAQANHHDARVGAGGLAAARADAGHETLDLGVLRDDVAQGLLILDHLRERCALLGLG